MGAARYASYADGLNFAGVDDVTSLWRHGSKMRNETDAKAAYEEALANVRAAALR